MDYDAFIVGGGPSGATAAEDLPRAGLRVAAVAGEKTNIKITTAEDWRLAATLEAYLQ